MERACFTFEIYPDKVDEYKRRHDEIWPELANAMTQCVVNMIIHHFEERLYLYMTAPSEEHFERSHTGEIAEKWLEYMATMMITDEDGKTILDEMDTAFVFGSYKDVLSS